MSKSDSIKKYMLQSALLWSSFPIIWGFLPVYLSAQGLTTSKIGILMALNPFMAVLVQPFLGMYADKASSKNRFFVFLMLGTMAACLLFTVSSIYAYVLVIGALVSVFQSGLGSVSESITLELLERIDKPYGPVRMAGTVGYSVISVIAGLLMKAEIKSVFYLTAFIGLMNILLVLRLPTVQGQQSIGKRASAMEVFADKRLTVFIVFAAIAQLCINFYGTFLPLFFLSVGGDKAMLGWVYFISAMSEIPFLLYAERIIKKLGIPLALSLAMGFIGIRFLLLILINSSAWVFAISLLHGCTFIVFTYSLAVYINKTVKKELRTTGQSMLAVASAVGRSIGAVLGGYLIESLGLKQTMLLSFALCVAAIFGFVVVMAGLKREPKTIGRE